MCRILRGRLQTAEHCIQSTDGCTTRKQTGTVLSNESRGWDASLHRGLKQPPQHPTNLTYRLTFISLSHLLLRTTSKAVGTVDLTPGTATSSSSSQTAAVSFRRVLQRKMNSLILMLGQRATWGRRTLIFIQRQHQTPRGILHRSCN